ncbi:MAG: DUF4831 family protein [Bacteroidales bacterium]|jgi:hypothetical protein|nr:DUF4831 family protein [Bacteroidales bacterium]
MKRLPIIIILMSVLISCKTSKTIVTPYKVMPITEKSSTITSTGVFYALPRQNVEVDILVRKQEFIKGPYAEFAEQLLGIKNVIKENNSIYSIENVSISQKSEVDPNQIYFVQFNDSKLALEYESGLILSGVNTSRNEFSEQNNRTHPQQVVQTVRTTNRPLIPMFNLVERTDTVFFNQMVDTQLVQRYNIRTVKTEKTPRQKAEEIVEQIAKIREDRNRLLTGFQEVNYEAAAIKYMNEEFNRMEDEYILLFIGTTKVSYETAHFDFLPENKDSLSIELARFSTSLGLLNSDTWVSDGKKVTLNITLDDNILTYIERFSQNIKLSKNGFYYSIPSLALVKIMLDDQVIYSTQMPFSQFGTTQSLAPDLLQIDFSPQTGEIRSVRTIE